MLNDIKGQYQDSGNPFKLSLPEKGTLSDSDHIKRPDLIADHFSTQAEPFSFHKFLTDHLLDILANNFFEAYTAEGASQFVCNFRIIADTIYDLEKHAADNSLKHDIIHFMELVLKKPEQELSQAEQAMETIIDEYGSLANGLHHYLAEYRSKTISENQ
ncbi:MAG: hypothetical protein WKF97_08345 [Chitinophagaceae bacterium]